MFEIKKQKGFTLIELLIVIAIIAILAGVVLVTLKIAKDKANQKAAYAEARSAQARALQCVTNDGYVLACYTNSSSIYNCKGNANPHSSPVGGNIICGKHTASGELNPKSSEKWPNLPSGYTYGDRGSGSEPGKGEACSSPNRGVFNFAVFKSDAKGGDNIFCCTQNGCKEMPINGVGYNKSDYVNTSSCGAGVSEDLDKTLCKCKKEAGTNELSDSSGGKECF